MSKLKDLEKFGQSVWIDNLSRGLLRSGDLEKQIAADGLKGMTSNPAIFEKAFGQGTDYDEDIAKYVDRGDDVGTIFRRIAVHDIQAAAEAFRPAYDAANGGDGFISMEVSPYLAMDTEGTLAEARSLWKEIARENLMIKVPATKAGLPAIRQLIGEGINVNITLLFARSVYAEVAEAYIAGLEMRDTKADLSRIASVASFFVSRIDTKVDAAIDEKLKAGADKSLGDLHGKIAVDNAKLAYQQYKDIFSGPRWEKLAARGAKPQRLLWASTGTKNKAYSDVLYVDTLIGPNTVNTMPPETMEAYRDHGNPASRLDTGIDEAKKNLAALEAAGISLDKITDELVVEGVQLFATAADKLYSALAAKRNKMLGGSLLQMSESLGEAEAAVKSELDAWTSNGNARNIWAKDKSLWTGSDEDKWLGWLDIAKRERGDLSQLQEFGKSIEKAKLTDVVLLGMGGSSLGADVLGETLPHREGKPRLHVLDSTDPDRIRTVEKAITLTTTLFIVSSKSGTTLEPNILKDYFYKRVADSRGQNDAGKQFVAITDPGSEMEQVARQYGFSHLFLGDPAIGGRFSVLSKFGLVPAAATGLDVERLLTETDRMVTSCSALTPASANPGVRLGVILGVLATKFGRDKVTIVATGEFASVGIWLEQLIAESTGKHGKGLVPIDRETPGNPSVYGKDRVFVYLHPAKDQSVDLSAFENASNPVIRIAVGDSYQLGQIFFLWEMAIATAGAVIGINPFDQPDVEDAKKKARAVTDNFEKTGELPKETPAFERDGIAVYADEAGREKIAAAQSLADVLRFHLGGIKANDYFALLSYVESSDSNFDALQKARLKVRDAKHVATCLEFGPRYLHSTGQAYKGGPNSGVFVVLTTDHATDLPIPNRKASFGTVEVSQAIGDFTALAERGRRAIRIHVKDTGSGIAALAKAVDQALG